MFPTFARVWSGDWQLPLWMSTPWWPADPLASKQRSLLRVLSAAVSERLEFAPLVACLAQEHRGRYRRRLNRLARRLAAGTSLPDALEQTPGALSDEQMLAIRFGLQSGSLSESMRSMVDRDDQSSSQIGHRLRQIGFYATIVSALFLLVLSFIMISIVPSFDEIIKDFNLDRPRMLELVIRVSQTVVMYGIPIVLGLLFCVWLVKSETSRRFIRRRISSRLLKPVAQLRSADLLNLLALVQQSGRPLPGALSTLARYHYDSLIRQKLLFVRNEVEQGADLWNSMATARLLSPAESRALASATSADSKIWTMHRLAQWKRHRVALRFDTYVDLLQPLVILLMAGIVLLTALATMTPLIEMISAMS